MMVCFTLLKWTEGASILEELRLLRPFNDVKICLYHSKLLTPTP